MAAQTYRLNDDYSIQTSVQHVHWLSVSLARTWSNLRCRLSEKFENLMMQKKYAEADHLIEQRLSDCNGLDHHSSHII